MDLPVALRVLAAASALLLAQACGDTRLPQQELTGSAMGTTFSVKLVGPPAAVDLDELGARVAAVLERIEGRTSTYLADSELSRFNAHRGGDWFAVSAELCALVGEALTLGAATGGAFDVTVGPLVNVWGFGPQAGTGEPPEPARIARLLESVGYSALHADCSQPALRKDLPDIYVDLSAYAKGYGVDALAALLDGAGVGNYLVEIGGELRVRGRNASGDDWAVAIESPLAESRAVHAIIRVTDTAVATSGDYRNYFEYGGRIYSHTIDPRTGYPVQHDAASVTVVAGEAAYADAMATALLVLGPDEGLAVAEREEVAAFFLVRAADGIAGRMSSRFAAEVSYQ
jgi:thiamine biosynthesis lipoprotein